MSLYEINVPTGIRWLSSPIQRIANVTSSVFNFSTILTRWNREKMAEPLVIRQILDNILKGTVRVPAFQRGFVWEPDMVAFFMDSLYKGYPFGSLLFWRTKYQLKVERKLGPFKLPENDPEYPIDYVLDGQQRITSIFGVFQNELRPEEIADWTGVYFDYRADPHVQESQFFVLPGSQVDPDRRFPLNTLFDTVAYRKATSSLDESTVLLVDKLQERFKEVRVPVQTFATEDRAMVAIVFERVNRKGVPLDTLQLLSAWTWSDEFDLQQEFGDLTAELEPFGFEEVGTDANLLLRCCAAVLAKDASPNTLISLNGTEVRKRFEEVVNGIKGSIDFLRRNLNVYSLENLPFQTLLVPMTVFFAHSANEQIQYSNEQRQRLLRWFWRTCFTRRYSSGVLRNLKTDIDEVLHLKTNAESDLGNFVIKVDPDYFTNNTFKVDSVNTKTFVLKLANCSPRTFISGAPINLEVALRDYNRNEFHHLYPRAFLKHKIAENPKYLEEYDPNALANFCFLSRADNIQLGGEAPSTYKNKLPSNPALSEILKSALCPESLFKDDYPNFVRDRSLTLDAEVARLVDSTPPNTAA